MTKQFEYKKLYIGDKHSAYAADVLNSAGAEGWEAINIMEYDAWFKREIPNVESTRNDGALDATMRATRNLN
jgi:hypothetical protein